MIDASAIAKIDPPASFYSLRHTYASLLASKGVPLQIVAVALGHGDVRMTMRHYSHLRPDHVAKAIRKSLPRFEKKKRSKVARL
jgi:integrase